MITPLLHRLAPLALCLALPLGCSDDDANLAVDSGSLRQPDLGGSRLDLGSGAGFDVSADGTSLDSSAADGASADGSTIDGTVTDGSVTDGSVDSSATDSASAADSAIACQTLTDETFVKTDWHLVSIKFEGGNVVADAMQEASGGNPGAYRKWEIELEGPGTTAHIAHLRNKDPFVPSLRGAVVSIDASVQAAWFTSTPQAGEKASVSLGIRQFSSFYWAGEQPLPSGGSWKTHISIDPNDFVKLHGLAKDPAKPDFSASGPKMDLGVITTNIHGTGGSGSVKRNVGIDNFKFNVCYTPK